MLGMYFIIMAGLYFFGLRCSKLERTCQLEPAIALLLIARFTRNFPELYYVKQQVILGLYV